ncbi:MAG: heparan-alpha-glucosaminide N-acetyltransferase domain-containing protein [Cyclobacterium sp.]|uniref:acyltransferase family protein n=1 Tax=unclassified Cyclobacterium TaxID=2615055 RepID=UPI0013D1CA8D|nr:heparan-alpha-glucosaminide N-acetyltransferase domain-containing protein [Cyclobacterium sp. SYSU L10401]
MKPTITRLISLDALRGFTIAAMILVNYPGSWSHVYPPLLHASWNGLTMTDFIYPFFLFIVGVSIAFAYTKRLQEGFPKEGMYKKIVVRSIKIFVVGVFLNLIPTFDFTDMRIAGVLQRIALVFLVCAFLFLNTDWKKQAYLAGSILLLYWLAMTLIPTPDEGLIILEPGRNLAAWIDRILLPGKMWEGSWDPEGLFSTLPAIVTGILGLLAGKILLGRSNEQLKANYLMAIGVPLVLLGLLWAQVFPINKHLWTSSFTLVTGGTAFIALGACYFLVDILGKQKGTSVGIIFGANAITVYVLADVLSLLFYGWEIGGQSLNTHFMNGLTGLGISAKLASLSYALLFVGINFIPAFILFRRKIFIKL